MQVNKFNFKTIKQDSHYGKFQFAPLWGGFGHTLGNCLRRVLLISIPGAAITKIKVNGADHLFTTIPGVKEDMVEISLNLKQIKFTYSKDEPITLHLSKKGTGPVLAKDIESNPTCTVANPDCHIATITDAKTSFEMDLVVEKGYGYTLVKDKQTDVFGEILLDTTFTPVIKVNYTVEPTRLGKRTDFDCLTLEVTTDGSVSPEEAVKKAATDFVTAMSQIASPREYEDEVITVEAGPINKAADISIEEIELPLRVTNALKKAGFMTIDDMIKAGRLEVRKAKNVGEKSIKTIEKWLKENNYTWK